MSTTAGSAQRSFGDLLPGNYNVIESIPAGWDLTSATCDNGDAPGNIDLGAGENVTCAFENTKQGSLTVVKRAIGGDHAFSFTSNTLSPATFNLTTSNGTAQQLFVGLAPGTYDVSESTPGDWTQTSATCSDGSNPVSIGIGPGEEVTCTFVNATHVALAVNLASFDAAAQAGHVLVTWETVSELDNAGFNLYRTATFDPPTAANLLATLPSQGPGSTQGFSYSYQDYAVTARRDVLVLAGGRRPWRRCYPARAGKRRLHRTDSSHGQ